MVNRLRSLIGFMLLSAMYLTLTACGGGGGASGSAGTSSDTVVSGVAAKGIIVNGTIKIYAVGANGSLKLLVTTSTNNKGQYSASVGNYTGPLLVEASGNYTDEATGLPKTVTPDAPMRAALPDARGTVSMAVTPLTELAVVKAGPTNLSATTISAANTLVSDIFKVDIVTTQPVLPQSVQDSTTTATQKDYTLTLATVSQMIATSGTSLTAVVTNLSTGITSTGMTTDTQNNFVNAANQFILNPKNATGLTSVSSTNLANVGGTTATYHLAIKGGNASTLVKGIQLLVQLPSGTTVRTDSNGVFPASFFLSGIAPQTELNAAKFISATGNTPATMSAGIISAYGFPVGEFATLTIDLPAGTTAPSASMIVIKEFVAMTDSSGNTDSSLSLQITSM